MKYKVIELKELTKEILEEMLAEAYEDGYRDGRGGIQITYRSPSFDREQDPYRIVPYGKEVKVDRNDSITNCPDIACSYSTETTNVKSINNAVHGSVAYQNNTGNCYRTMEPLIVKIHSRKETEKSDV